MGVADGVPEFGTVGTMKGVGELDGDKDGAGTACFGDVVCV